MRARWYGMSRAFLLLVAIAYPSLVDAGPCLIQPLTPTPLVNAPVAPGGGVIVALLRGVGSKSAMSAVDKAWRFRDVNKLVEPTFVDIAPGLAVYALPATGGPELALLDADGKELAKVVRASKATAALAAPALASITYESRRYSPPRGSGTSTTGIADIGAIPAGAAALIVYEVTKTGNVARSWVSVTGADPKATKIAAYQSGGRCNPTLPGIEPIANGAKVVVAWLDTSGRLSPVSKPVTARTVTVK
jgi:hypothetical protein